MPNEDGPADPEASIEQKIAIDRVVQDVAGRDALCSFALYAGYLREDDRGRSDGFDEPQGTWHFGRLNYVLFSGPLAASGYAGLDRRWGSAVPFEIGRKRPIVELSYLWTADHSVFVASPPDAAVTVVAGDNTLAEHLLSLRELDAHEWL
ncbi:MAG: hypothetical protein EOO27_34130 [Comamonadaceae bacterium]|nr:MAG: hypothetical protein EOO27_34130 [Comamonadaceae bacterium]